jgi:ABC-type nitrate/sulfonate/bicarbonate transport system permease component
VRPASEKSIAAAVPAGPRASSAHFAPPFAGSARRASLTRVLQVGSLVALLAVWQGVVTIGHVSALFLVGPVEVARTLITDLRFGDLPAHIRASGVLFAVGYTAAIVAGIPLGFVLGVSRIADDVISPYLFALYSTPSIAFISLLILWFGIGILPRALIVFLSAVFPIALNTQLGVATVEPVLLETAKAFNANRWEVFSKILFPSAVPSIATGLRFAVTRAIIAVFFSEFFGATAGLGFFIMRAGFDFKTSQVLAGVSVLTFCSVVLAAALSRLEKRLSAWRQ